MPKAQDEAVKAGKDVYQWKGKVECCACGHKQKSAIEIPVEWDEPIIPLECEDCRGMTCAQNRIKA